MARVGKEQKQKILEISGELQSEGLSEVRIGSLMQAALRAGDLSVFNLPASDFRQKAESLLEKEGNRSGNAPSRYGKLERDTGCQDLDEGSLGRNRFGG